MSWFLVLLFWNPAIQNFDVADGWYPLEYTTEIICEMKEDYLRMYLSSITPDNEKVMIDCIQAFDVEEAIATAKR